jgi:hypothetical protein
MSEINLNKENTNLYEYSDWGNQLSFIFLKKNHITKIGNLEKLNCLFSFDFSENPILYLDKSNFPEERLFKQLFFLIRDTYIFKLDLSLFQENDFIYVERTLI